jgi:hypothetical protein
VSFEGLVKMMVDEDLARLRNAAPIPSATPVAP